MNLEDLIILSIRLGIHYYISIFDGFVFNVNLFIKIRMHVCQGRDLDEKYFMRLLYGHV